MLTNVLDQSRLLGQYVRAPKSHTVQTAWSCLALMYAGYPDQEPIKRGIQLIIGRQKPNGKWEQEYPVGSGVLTWYDIKCSSKRFDIHTDETQQYSISKLHIHFSNSRTSHV